MGANRGLQLLSGRRAAWLCLAVTTLIALSACKANLNKTNSPNASQSNATIDKPGPLSNDANDEQLRKQFLALVAQYKSMPEKQFSLSTPGTVLSRDRRPKALNVKMRAPLDMIAKTAGKQGATDQGAALRAAGGKIRRQIAGVNTVSVIFPEATDDRYMGAVVEFLSADHRTEQVEPDYVVKAISIPNDPRFSELWGLKNNNSKVDINVLPAWETTTGSRDVVVGVIDTGIDCTHPDLADNCWVNPGEDGTDGQGKDKRSNGIDDDSNGYIDDWRGWNFINETNNATDDNRHGTHVAGTIGAVGNNNLGVVGVNWQVSLVPLKFLDSSGSGYISDAIEAVEYATKMKFFATNNSWGGGPYNDLMLQAIQRADSAGIHFVAAAGNSGSNNDVTPQYPANYDVPNVISVAAINSTGALASFSCWGKTTVDVAAPGDGILSTVPGNQYESLRGTSMATPHVTGAIALIKAKFPGDAPQTIRNRLLQSVTALPDSTQAERIRTGGMINLQAAFGISPDITPPSAPTSLTFQDRDWGIADEKTTLKIGTVRANISFRASTDNGSTGKASRYQMRISTSQITSDEIWAAATPVTVESITTSSTDNIVKATLKDIPLTFVGWIAVRAYDESDNQSGLSESVKFKSINFLPRETYDGSSSVGWPNAWTTENDPDRGTVYSDAIGNYAANATSRMTLREFRIPDGFTRMALRYWTRYSIDNFGARYGSPEDFGRVYVQGEFGFNTKIDEVAGYSDWKQRTIDLTQIAWDQRARGRDTITVYFELTSNSWWQESGWLADDIEFIVNDAMLTAQGVPDEFTLTKELSVKVAAMQGTLYSAKHFTDGTAACPSVIYDNQDPKTPLSTPFTIDQGLTIGRQSLCVKAKIPAITNPVYINHVWVYDTASAQIQASGFPVGRSNTKSFTLKAAPAAGSIATFYRYGLTELTTRNSLDNACVNPLSNISWSEWIPIAQTSTVALSPAMSTGTTTKIICVSGKTNSNVEMLTPKSYSWIADFEGPDVAFVDTPNSINNLSSFKLTVKSSDTLASCKAKVTSPISLTCPPVTDSYVDCSNQPSEHVVNVQKDGTHSVCVYGFDSVGNSSPTPAKFEWNRRTAPPTAVINGSPPKTAESTDSMMSIRGTDVVNYRFATATNAQDCKTYSAIYSIYNPFWLKLIPGGDGPRALCVRGIDALGNEQVEPTVLSWVQDTMVLPISFSGVPAKFSNALVLSVKVNAGEPGTYIYAVVPGTDCNGSNISWSSPRLDYEYIGSSLPAADGVYTLCALFTDKTGNKQTTPTSYTWTKRSVPPTASITQGLPQSPNSAASISLQVAGDAVQSYQFALVKSANSTCASGVTYSDWFDIGTRLTATITKPGNQFITLCLIGKDLAGNIQKASTIYRWLRHVSTPATTIATEFATIQRGTRGKGTQILTFTRTSNISTIEKATVLVCKYTPSTGALTNCISRTVNFTANATTASASFSPMSAGSWVGLLIPASSARGRAIPLEFTY